MEGLQIDTQFLSIQLMTWGPKVLSALLVFLLGWWLSKRVSRLAFNVLVKARTEETLASFVRTLIHAVLVVLTVIVALTQVGVQTTSLIAVIGAAGLAIALALKDSLENIAAGILLTVFRPFRLGNYIECSGVGGSVEQISLLSTQLRTPDNKHVILPNATLLKSTVVNYSAKGERRIDLVVGVGYKTDLAHAKAVLQRILAEESRILPEPAPVIGVLALADNSVNFAVRPWVKSEDYWEVTYALNQRIKTVLDEEGIEIPFPQRTLHIEGGTLSVEPKVQAKEVSLVE
ncbi:mechanosensitive ion channel family protein [Balneatrix alpica]|uniref:Small-conductance mechanosensitive channel n=1 Tax=Balneatrix alpica TaxID=75684 RepID=A0ABV5Z8R3_9GAMM|nr:mechanosensitive ion channel domain-containing protein [Balneatrix alpica]